MTSPKIPRLIHQTWSSQNVPPSLGNPGSWQQQNTTWTYCFWSDETLRTFMADHFPDLLPLFDTYPKMVQKADLARYCLLYRFGGVYADIDTRCLTSLEPLAHADGIILCEEPAEHQHHAHRRGMPRLLFNGTMASPAGHPFWKKVIDLCRLMHPNRDRDVLETTGPLLLSAAVADWPKQEDFLLHSSHLFAEAHAGSTGSRFGQWSDIVFSEHHWKGSWHRPRKVSVLRRIVSSARKHYHLHRNDNLHLDAIRQTIDRTALQASCEPGSDLPTVAIVIPVRNGAATIHQNLQQILELDYPKDRLHLIYGEGDSTDATPDMIAALIAEHKATFASMASIATRRNSPRVDHNKRWKREYQRSRRLGLSAVRNDILYQALKLDTEWILWLDADVIGLPRDLLQTLMAAGSKIVTPNCVTTPGGVSYDLNAFLNIADPDDTEYYRHLHDGIQQPPADYWLRRHLDDLRYLDRVPLHAVGGTALLVHASVHRAGINFPERPYRDLVETEAFGHLARDLGIIPLGLPRVEVIHAS